MKNPASFALQTVGPVSLQAVEGLAGLVSVTVLLSSILAPPTVVCAYLSSALPADVRGTAPGSIRTGFILLGVARPWVAGSLAGRGLFVDAFWLPAAAVVLTALLCGFVTDG